ncbi:unnamed protein product [Pleuronectes platessa]|uniref:Uncharacterized protein n=1 Tax=Pleuronectes platessa TaxID=8262 RepID=A0A9N7Y7A6_PLEPL|nr:unnamed protein product [Pleuronectes platessa]
MSYRTFSDEENEELTQEELGFTKQRSGDVNFKDSLCYVILPHDGEKVTSGREGGNDSDRTEQERNEFNRTEQQSRAGTEEDVSEMPNKHWDKVNCSHRPENSPDECALNASLHPKCQHNSAECTNTDCVGVVPNGVKQDVGESDTLHENEEIAECSSDVNIYPEESEESGTGTGHSDEEEAEEAEEQNDEPSCSENDEEEEVKCAEEEEDEEEGQSSPDFSIHQHPLSPQDNPSNISITRSDQANSPPPGSTFTRATFSPGSPTEKQIQLPALFSGLRVLRKGVVGPGHDTVSHIKPQSLGARRATLPERPEDARVQGNFLDQISQFLSLEKKAEENEERTELKTTRMNRRTRKVPEKEDSEKEEDVETSGSFDSAKSPVSSAEAAFDAFKAFFTPRLLKKDPADKVDLDAVRKKIRSDKDVLRAIFERTSSKTPEKKDSSDGKSEASTPGEGEERTPGRLQAVWPPVKEEKVGLKYTEAEHQADLLQLKRECKEELEKLQEEFGRELSSLRVDHEDSVARLESTVAELQARLSQAGSQTRGEVRDVSVSTGDDCLQKSFRTVCVQTDRETFVRTPEDGEVTETSPRPQKVTPRKLDLASISLSLAGQWEDTAPPGLQERCSWSHSPNRTSTSPC